MKHEELAERFTVPDGGIYTFDGFAYGFGTGRLFKEVMIVEKHNLEPEMLRRSMSFYKDVLTQNNRSIDPASQSFKKPYFLDVRGLILGWPLGSSFLTRYFGWKEWNDSPITSLLPEKDFTAAAFRQMIFQDGYDGIVVLHATNPDGNYDDPDDDSSEDYIWMTMPLKIENTIWWEE